MTVNASSNRLTSHSAAYDGAGNLSAVNHGGERYVYEHDAANRLKHLRSNHDLARIYLYNAGDERIHYLALAEKPSQPVRGLSGTCRNTSALGVASLRHSPETFGSRCTELPAPAEDFKRHS